MVYRFFKRVFYLVDYVVVICYRFNKVVCVGFGRDGFGVGSTVGFIFSFDVSV